MDRTRLVNDSVPHRNAKGEIYRDFLVRFRPRRVCVAAGKNWKSTANTVDNGINIGFLVLTLIGVVILMLMANPDKMIRSDRTKDTTLRHPSWKTEVIGLFVMLKTDPMINLLFPIFFTPMTSTAIFSIRVQDNACYWISQIIGSVLIGPLLDQKSVSRCIRAYMGLMVLILMVIVHIWEYYYPK
ncbi:hypothetical protein EDD18DRAFT_32552 [Armillaria luteobubalina]|uniref:Uncharacterized protein n=1 Tax=Armillaria luteobubalina TaxID=153913 RepID=A0AA39QQX4_9AGAR|nr:hypothetical protein EDD18DRAFT_32552 [Armillaria luteobubalina]